ncbi:MAG: CocE/NonD family hydrolase [Deltaproteobacteria bacterium]|nr:CocE/NonD family hydrolase [Deltaproteobacteria bacterium]
MRDGGQLSANVFRPDKPGKFPVIITFIIYGKDTPWSEIHPGWGVAYTKDSPTLTKSTAFEAPDPDFWVPYDYVLILVDSRGFGRSPGQRFGLQRDFQDHYDAIEWAGTQEWSNGNVGMSGVSYLGTTQWWVAPLRPPHLKAINPWEAFTDFSRDIFIKGGIPETEFLKHLGQLIPPINPALNQAPAKDEPPAPSPELENITVPALVCATWSDQELHTRGTFWAYEKISSKYKWLYTHGRQKWAEFYSVEARDIQKKFFDCFLKGSDSRIKDTPRVRLEGRETLDRYTVRYENEWPIARTQYKELYLDAKARTLNFNKVKKGGKVSYDSADGTAIFDITFDQDIELTGHMKLKLWVCPEEANDMDLFITLKKLDSQGNEVCFDSWSAPSRYPVALGWLRLSQRELDEEKSTLWQPYLKHEREKKVKPGEIVPCEIEILPSSTLFRKGETLRLVISGKYHVGSTWFGYNLLVNEGTHSIYAGGEYNSYLLISEIDNK